MRCFGRAWFGSSVGSANKIVLLTFSPPLFLHYFHCSFQELIVHFECDFLCADDIQSRFDRQIDIHRN